MAQGKLSRILRACGEGRMWAIRWLKCFHNHFSFQKPRCLEIVTNAALPLGNNCGFHPMLVIMLRMREMFADCLANWNVLGRVFVAPKLSCCDELSICRQDIYHRFSASVFLSSYSSGSNSTLSSVYT